MNNPSSQQRNVDELLRTFFRREMPDPWPQLDLPSAESLPILNQRPRRWPVRLALAAAIAFFLASYFLLASWFPSQNGAATGPDSQFIIGHRPKLNPAPAPLEPPVLLPDGRGPKVPRGLPR